MIDFSSLGLSKSLLKVLPELGFENPTPIQAQTIPILLNAPTDLLGLAQTGTGKTAAFGLPLIDLIDTGLPHTQAVILAPTRELCQQIAQQLMAFSRYKKGLHMLAVYGGSSIERQMMALRKPTQIIIATPGRLIDLIERRKADLSKVKIAILDEADEMLNMGFKEDIDQILRETPNEKNTWLFSATMPSEIRRIVKSYMKDPAEVKVSTGNEVNRNISHQFIKLRADDRVDWLTRVIDSEPDIRGIIFCRTKLNTADLSSRLVQSGYAVEALHGDLSQAQRDRVMNAFKDRRLKLIVATDVAARGIDVDDLTHVIHYTLPDDMAFYTHRAGRTARAGKTGISLAFVTSRDVNKIRQVEKTLKINFEPWQAPDLSGMYAKRLNDWTTALFNKAIPDSAKELSAAAIATLQGVPQDELIEKVIAMELERMQYRDPAKEKMRQGYDGNERRSEGSDRRSEGRRGEKEGGFGRDGRKSRKSDSDRSFDRPIANRNDKMAAFFINVGAMDGMNKKELIEFVAHQTRVERKNFGLVTVLKKHSYFEVPEALANTVTSRFDGIVVNGRPLRVNRDAGPEAAADAVRAGKKKDKKKK